MVTESTEIAFLCRIDELTLAQGHEIEMFDTFLIILDHAFAKSGFRDSFTNILEDEIVRPQLNVCPEAVALFLSLDDGYIGIETS